MLTAMSRDTAVTAPNRPDAPPPASDTKVVPVRHYGRMLLSVVVIVLALQIGVSLATNEYVNWSVVGAYMLNGGILVGLWNTLAISVLSVVIGLAVAVVTAVMRISKSRIISGIAYVYVFVFRGLPLIVVLILVGNVGLFMQVFAVGVPFTDIVFFSAPMSSIMTPFIASVVGLSLCASAYMSEIVRSGLLSVNRGQHQAAMALGMTPVKTLWFVTLPQAVRVIMPPMGNEFINTLKASALVSVIAGGDLLTVAQSIAGVTYRTIELLFVATIWYLIIIIVFSAGQYFVERKFAEK